MQSRITPVPSYTCRSGFSCPSLYHTPQWYREAIPQPCLQPKRSTWLLGSRCDWLAAHRGPRARQGCPKLPVCALKGEGRIDSSRTAAADILSQASTQGCWVASSELEETRRAERNKASWKKQGSLQGGRVSVCLCVSACVRACACMSGRPPSPRSERCLCLPLTSVQRSPVPAAGSCCQPLPVCSSRLAECGCVCMLVQPLSDCRARGDFLAALVHIASADAMGTLLPPQSSAPLC